MIDKFLVLSILSDLEEGKSLKEIAKHIIVPKEKAIKEVKKADKERKIKRTKIETEFTYITKELEFLELLSALKSIINDKEHRKELAELLEKVAEEIKSL